MFISQETSMYNHNSTIPKHIKKGFSLLEIIVVMGLIAVIAGIVYPILNTQRKKAAIAQAKQILGGIDQGIGMYYTDIGEYPKDLEDLRRRPSTEPASTKWTTGGYLPTKKGEKEGKIPLDPWGNKPVYRLNQEGSEKPYELYFYGPDGKKGNKKDYIHAE